MNYLNVFARDDEKNTFVYKVQNKTSGLNGDEVVACLNKFAHDDEKDMFLDTMCWKKLYLKEASGKLYDNENNVQNLFNFTSVNKYSYYFNNLII